MGIGYRKSSTINFKGFEADTLTSTVTGKPRLKYDRNKPFEKELTYQNFFKPKDSVLIPHAYLIPQGWHNVLELLKLNQVEYFRFESDTTLKVASYRIKDYKTRNSPYEGHYLHYNTSIETSIQSVKFREGDYYVPTQQSAIRYLLETLEPQAVDSFFNWNFLIPFFSKKKDFHPMFGKTKF